MIPVGAYYAPQITKRLLFEILIRYESPDHGRIRL